MATAAAAAAMPPPHPHLSTPILYLSGVPSSVADEDIVEALRDCLRLRLFLKRDEADPAAPLTGKVEFESLEKAECAYATCNGQRLSSGHTLALTLSPPSSSPSNPDPEPRATPRIIKQLPRTFTASQVFALCRPFGPIHSASLLLSPSPQATAGGGPPRFKGQALVTFYDELDAVEMQNALHFAEVGGQNVAVQVWDAKRGAATKARASLGTLPTTTTASPRLSPNEKVSRWAAATQQQHATPSKPSRYAGLGASSPSSLPSTPMRRDVSNASSTASRWSSDGGVGGGGAASEGGGAGTDPRNLFIKNLDASFSTADLRALFVPFGALTSASVALDPARGKASKGFGFVAFERREDAERARREVDGRAVRGKRVVVRVHERKEVRRERLERAFAAAAGAGAGPVDEVRAGVEGLSTGPTTPSSSPRAFKPVSPLSPADSPPSSRSTAPASGEQSEHDRLVAAVGDVLGAGESEKRDEVVRLIEGLPKKDRKMCLFNSEVLKQKVHDALAVLEDDDGGDEQVDSVVVAEQERAKGEVQGPSTDPPLPTTLAALAALPCSRILPLLPLVSSRLSLPGAGDFASTDAFMDSLEGKAVSEVKQKLGERLFKVVKECARERGVKGAPRITIELLDTEDDLRSLARVAMHCRPVIAEKVALVANTLAAAKA